MYVTLVSRTLDPGEMLFYFTVYCINTVYGCDDRKVRDLITQIPSVQPRTSIHWVWVITSRLHPTYRVYKANTHYDCVHAVIAFPVSWLSPSVCSFIIAAFCQHSILALFITSPRTWILNDLPSPVCYTHRRTTEEPFKTLRFLRAYIWCTRQKGKTKPDKQNVSYWQTAFTVCWCWIWYKSF